MTHLDNRAIMLYVTVVTGKRNAMLADKAVQDCIVAAWKAAADWLVGRYVIMPDHIHFFCAPATYPPPDFHRWMKQWKAQVSRSFPIGLRAGRAHGRVALVATEAPADTSHGRVALVATGTPADTAHGRVALVATGTRRTRHMGGSRLSRPRPRRTRHMGGSRLSRTRPWRTRHMGGSRLSRPRPRRTRHTGGSRLSRPRRDTAATSAALPNTASHARPSRTRPPARGPPEHGLPRAAGYLV